MQGIQMKCKYPGCPNDVPTTGTRREYCSNAHKQADYRRRKALLETGTTASSLELSQALMRISTLEQTVKALEESMKNLDCRLQDWERLIPQPARLEPARTEAEPSRQVQTQYHDLVSIPLSHKGIAFFLPDFTRALQEGYWCDAVEQDVRAWLAVLPERSVPHGYYLTQKMWDKVNPSGKTGRKQEKRARDLLATLISRVEEVMKEAGWTVIDTTGHGTQVWGLAVTSDRKEQPH